ncbi:hypothetical protein EIP91_003455 [Steccherinum ochraceum]|uniref:Nitrogen permease regulator 3 n=1 Tax=Steccherinum ochraceum TaxID=92696 RepID=A0A4R0RIY8_9APHY|nr:hypothetical protein EIP91_003455 [Steccherinum ochraceum]
MCHQRFELVVDDLAFVGHPVCADPDGTWRFKPERAKMAPRGRGSKKGQSPPADDKPLTPEKNGETKKSQQDCWLQTFHFVFVLDSPDPSSSQSGNIAKYFDIIYEQMAFTITAVLYQEQVLHNFVEVECDRLGALENDHIDRGKPFADFMSQALKTSSVASAMKTLYEAIKDNNIARISVNDFPLELQLPPYLDYLLHNDDTSILDAQEDDDFEFSSSSQDGRRWRTGIRAVYEIEGPQLATQDRELAEQLIKFLDLASITLSLADMASLLDWDLESQVYPTILYLLPAEYARTFTHSALPALPQLLSLITSATYEQTANHFYASVVRSKELIPLYHEVVIWMLKRDLLGTLHLRIRVVATPELKEHVRLQRSLAIARKSRVGTEEKDGQPIAQSDKAKEHSPSGAVLESSPSVDWDDPRASIICDPGRATPMERQWLSAMSEGKDEYIRRRFERINQYFNGRCTDDEILHKADITRKQLREVLHVYNEYTQTFLHPS